MKKLIFSLIILSMLAVSAERKPKLAVMEIEDRTGTLEQRFIESGTGLLRAHLSSSGEFIVIDKGRQADAIKKMVKQEKKESYKQCYDSSCQIPLGQALSADTILRSTVSELGGVYSLAVEMVDLAKEATVKAGNADFDGSAKGLRSAVQSVVSQLTGQSTGSDGQINLSVGSASLKKLDTFEGSSGAVTDVNADILVAYDRAVKIEKSPDAQEHAESALKAWEKVASFKENNPYLDTAKKRVKEWREYITSRREFEAQYQRDRGNILKLLPLSVVTYEQKRDMVVQYIKSYSGKYGINDIVKLLKKSDDRDVAEKLIRDKKVRDTMTETAGNLCSENDAAACIWYAEKVSNSDEKRLTYYSKACQAGSDEGCRKKKQIREKIEREKSEKERARKEELEQQKKAALQAEKRAEQEKQRQIREKMNAELDTAGRKTRRIWAWTGILSGAATVIAGGVMLPLAAQANSDGHDAYEDYRAATNSNDAQSYWSDVQNYRDKEVGLKTAGGTMLGVGGALLTTGIVLFFVRTDEEKKIEKKYDISFYGDPFSRTAGVTVSF